MATTYWKSSLATLQAITGASGDRAAVTTGGVTTIYYWDGATWTQSSIVGASISDTAYDATTWDNVTDVAPSKNAVRDKIEAMCLPLEIDAHTAQVLTAAQLSSTKMATIHNYGQAAADIDNTLPTPAANLGALCTVSTAQAGNYWRFSCTGKIYLDGSAIAKNYVQYSAPAVGNYFSFFTAKIADGSYAYYISSGVGILTTN